MRRLLVFYGMALVSAVLVAFLIPLGLLARSLAHDRAVEAAREEAQGLTVIANNASRARLREAVRALNTGPRQTTAFLPDGTRIGFATPRSASIDLAAQGRSFTASTAGGVEVLLPVVGSDGVTVIRTFVPHELLTSGVEGAWVTLAIVGLVLLTGAMLVGDRIAARLSRSVTELAVVADRVGAGDLSATVTPAGPREVASVGRILNRLGARISTMLADERELGADLSHRLRTPVTALRLDAESLRDPDERAQIGAHIDSLVRAVDEAVSAARHPSHLRRPEVCDAISVVSERGTFWAVLAEDTHRRLEIELPSGRSPVAVSEPDLGAALDVLVDNVFTHTPDGTGFRLAVGRPTRDVVDIIVEDDGPGIDDRSLASRGVSGAGSTGIGLDVARRTAVIAGGSFRVERSNTGGARIVIRLPQTTLADS